MSCIKLKDFDKEDGNYQLLLDAIKDGKITIREDECSALIRAHPLEAAFKMGMSTYIGKHGYNISLIDEEY